MARNPKRNGSRNTRQLLRCGISSRSKVFAGQRLYGSQAISLPCLSQHNRSQIYLSSKCQQSRTGIFKSHPSAPALLMPWWHLQPTDRWQGAPSPEFVFPHQVKRTARDAQGLGNILCFRFLLEIVIQSRAGLQLRGPSKAGISPLKSGSKNSSKV